MPVVVLGVLLYSLISQPTRGPWPFQVLPLLFLQHSLRLSADWHAGVPSTVTRQSRLGIQASHQLVGASTEHLPSPGVTVSVNWTQPRHPWEEEISLCLRQNGLWGHFFNCCL